MPHTSYKFGCDQAIMKGTYLGNEVLSRLYLSILSRDFPDSPPSTLHARSIGGIRLVPIKKTKATLFGGTKCFPFISSALQALQVWMPLASNGGQFT